MLVLAVSGVFADGPGIDALTRFSQLPRMYETDPSVQVSANIHGVVTHVFHDAREGLFVIAEETRSARGGIIVRAAPGEDPPEGAYALEVGDTVAVSGRTEYSNRTVGIVASSVLRTGRMQLEDPPTLKVSDFRKGWLHLRRNRVEGIVHDCVAQPRAGGGADSVLWLTVGGTREPLAVLVRGGLRGAAARKGASIDARGLSYTDFDSEGNALSSRLIVSARDVRIIVPNYSFHWRVAAGLLGVVLAVGVVAFCTAWLRSRRKRRIMRLLDADRRRIADDLHDNMQQLLAGVGFRLSAAVNVAGDRDAVLLQLAHAQKALEHSKAGLRSVLWGLQEAKESPDSLTGLLRYAASRMPHWEGVVSISGEGTEPPGARTMGARLLMIMQEAVGNALVHGGAKRVDVKLTFSGTGLAMTVRDDGCGFDASRPLGSGHLGLSSMRRRAEELGGVFSVKSDPGRGTEIRIEVK